MKHFDLSDFIARDSATPIARIEVTEDSAPDHIVVPDAQLLVTAKFKKIGSDLTLTGTDGKTFIVEGYFNLLKRPDLVAPGGGGLSADVVAQLAVSETPGQYAQAGAPAGAVAIGRVERLGGSATVQHANGTVSELHIGDMVYQGDVVETRDGSQLGVSFTDGTAFNLGTNARMVLSELVYSASGQSNSGVFNLVKGTMTFVAGQVAKSGDMRVVTPVSTMGIRGTTAQVTVSTDAFGNTISVVYSLMADPDGNIGFFDILDSGGNVIGTVRTTDSTVVVTPSTNLTLLAQTLQKTPEVIQAELAVAQILFPIFLSNPANFIQTPQQQDLQPKGTSPVGTAQALTLPPQGLGDPIQTITITETISGTISPSPGSGGSSGAPPPQDVNIPEQQNQVEIPANLLPLINIDASNHLVEAAGGNPGVATTSTIITKSDLNASDTVSYDTTALANDKWNNLGNGIFAKAGAYGTAALNTAGIAAATLIAEGWSNVGGGLYEKVVVFTDANGNQFSETVRVNTAANTLTYALDNAKADPLAGGSLATDQFIVHVIDNNGGQNHNVATFTIDGTNDAAILSADVVNRTEGNAAADISMSGHLTISDVDNPQTFQTQTDVAGLYGKFSIAADGSWTYVANSAHNEFAAGETYTDTFQVLSSDGTATSVTINILGTDDSAVVAADVRNLTEANDAAAISASGKLEIVDPDTPQTFQAQTDVVGLYGKFSIAADGSWTYVADNAHNEFAAGATYTDVFQVFSADGVSTSITINIAGTNDAATLSADVVNLTEGNTASDISTSGHLTISDVDSPQTFQVQTDVVGLYGTFSIATDGSWTYVADNAHNEFAAGETYTDIFQVFSADGVATSVTINIAGTNDAATLSVDAVNLTEGNAASDISTSGHLTISDVDSPQTFQAQTDVIGLYGTFSIAADGSWTYVADSAHNEFAAGETYTDTFQVHSSDGTATSVAINIDGTNDAPVAQDDAFNIQFGHTLHIAAPDLLNNDADAENDTLTALIDSGAIGGILKINSDGSFDFTPTALGTAGFTYEANDGTSSSNAASVAINVSAGSDTNDQSAGTGNQVLVATGAINNILGGSGNDTIIGNNNDNVLSGGAGNDTVFGGIGNDILIGGAGNDTFVFRTPVGHDTVADFQVGDGIDHDTLDLKTLGFTSVMDVLNHATDVGNDLVIQTDSFDITLLSVSKAALEQHQSAILVA